MGLGVWLGWFLVRFRYRIRVGNSIKSVIKRRGKVSIGFYGLNTCQPPWPPHPSLEVSIIDFNQKFPFLGKKCTYMEGSKMWRDHPQWFTVAFIHLYAIISSPVHETVYKPASLDVSMESVPCTCISNNL